MIYRVKSPNWRCPNRILGYLLYRQRDWTASMKQHNLAIDTLSEFDHLNNVDVAEQLAMAFSYLAEPQMELNDKTNNPKAAEATSKKALALFEFVLVDCRDQIESEEKKADIEYFKFMTLMNLGNVQGKLAEVDSAKANLAAALEGFKRISREHPDERRYQHRVARCIHNQSALLINHDKDLRGALAKMDEAEPILDGLALKFPFSLEYQHEIARKSLNYGVIYQNQARVLEAYLQYTDAKSEVAKLSKENPADEDFKYTLKRCDESLAYVEPYALNEAGITCNTGNSLQDEGDLKGSLKKYKTAIEVLTAILSNNPGNKTAKKFLRNSYFGRARALDSSENFADAVTAWANAVNFENQLPDYFKIRQAFSLARLGDLERSTTVLESVDLSNQLVNPEYYVDAVKVFGILATATLKNSNSEHPSLELQTRLKTLVKFALASGIKNKSLSRQIRADLSKEFPEEFIQSDSKLREMFGLE